MLGFCNCFALPDSPLGPALSKPAYGSWAQSHYHLLTRLDCQDSSNCPIRCPTTQAPLARAAVNKNPPRLSVSCSRTLVRASACKLLSVRASACIPFLHHLFSCQSPSVGSC